MLIAYIKIAIIGIIATVISGIVLQSIQSKKTPDINMMTTMGTLFTSNIRMAKWIGILSHVCIGLVMAFIYFEIAGYFGFTSNRDFIYFCTIAGFSQGLIMSFFYVILIAEHHPLRKFRRAGFAVVAVHGLSHLLYGIILGFSAALIHPELEAWSTFGRGIM
ncbi:MAG: hypothetical protein NT027_00595 [Proteobacteria bacterium]|nr:hypothetical protein [Pseudomonadota bacterium]